MPERYKHIPTSCTSKRQLSGVSRRCDRGYRHDGPYHATTMTGVDRYWVTGIQVEFATAADAVAEAARRAEASVPAPDAGGLELSAFEGWQP